MLGFARRSKVHLFVIDILVSNVTQLRRHLTMLGVFCLAVRVTPWILNAIQKNRR